VVISHCNGIIGLPEYYSKMALPDWHVASLFAVAAFFSISGFIIVVASFDRAALPRTSRGEFVRRRFVRIVPFLWLCIVGYNFLSWAGTHQFDWPAALRTFVVWPVGELKPNVAWSLRHELLFYAIYALAILGGRPRYGILAAWFAASAVFYVVSYDMGLAAPVLGQDGFETVKVLMGGDHGANFQFALGLLLAHLFLLHPERLPIGKVPPAMILVLCAGACLAVSWWPMDYGLPVSLLWTALAAPVLAAAICARPGIGWPARLGRVLGDASFAIYLVHNPVVLVILAVAQKLHFAIESEAVLLCFLAVCVTLAMLAGIVTHIIIEAPLIRWCERLTRPSAKAPARILVD